MLSFLDDGFLEVYEQPPAAAGAGAIIPEANIQFAPQNCHLKKD